MSEEKCKFYKKQFLSNYCELFKQPCYGKHCNFIKEFTRLNELEQELENAKEENEKLTQQNKQMVETLKYIKSITNFEQVKDLPEQRGKCIYQFKLVNSECIAALKEVNNEK